MVRLAWMGLFFHAALCFSVEVFVNDFHFTFTGFYGIRLGKGFYVYVESIVFMVNKQVQVFTFDTVSVTDMEDSTKFFAYRTEREGYVLCYWISESSQNKTLSLFADEPNILFTFNEIGNMQLLGYKSNYVTITHENIYLLTCRLSALGVPEELVDLLFKLVTCMINEEEYKVEAIREEVR